MLKAITKRPKQTGDTLVEVMISIAIVALAIAVTYAISGKNLNVGITARERTSAVGLVQAQIERMNEVQQVNPTALTSLRTPIIPIPHFCFDVNNLTNNTPVLNGAVAPDTNTLGPPNNDAANYTNAVAPLSSCVSGGKYYLDVTYVAKGGAGTTAYGDSFAFTAKWYRVGGGTDQNVTIYYRPW